MTRRTVLETKCDFLLSSGRCARGAAVSNDRLSWMYRLLQVLPSDNEKALWEDLERLVIKIEMRVNDSNDFRPGGLEEIAQGRGRCPQCAVLVRWRISFLFL